MNSTICRYGVVAGVLVGLASAAGAADYYWNGTAGANYTSQNWESPSGTPTTSTPGSWDRIYNTKGGKVILTSYKDPGYFQFSAGELEILAGGTLQPPGNGGAAVFQGPATLTINGGTLTGNGPTGARYAGAVLNLYAGTWTTTGGGGAAFYANGGSTSARVNHTGGTLATGGYSLVLGQQDMWGHANGDYYLGDAAGSTGTFTGSGSLIVGNITNKMSGSGYQRTTYGTFVGHGTVGLTGILRNNGYVTADGYGLDRTLDLSSFTAVDNTVDNDQYRLTADNNFYYGKGGTGWFATRKGKLVLPSLTVASGDSTRNWGEPDSDSNIDLINSVRLSFHGVTGGSLAVSLLAADRNVFAPTVATGGVGFYQFDPSGGFAFGSGTVDLTFRYDDVLAGAGESALKLFKTDAGGYWQPLAFTLDTTNNLITATGVNAFSYFGVGQNLTGFALPEPGTLLLAGAAAAFVVQRRRRR